MGALARPVPIVGAGAISAHGLEWRGLSQALRRGCEPTESVELAASHPGTRSFEVKTLSRPESAIEKRARLLMSRSAILASMATDAALRETGWHTLPRREGTLEDVGFYLGVGASGGSVTELTAMLAASVENRELSLTRFGNQGLAAVNPLFAFQLMNNFTLCHSAISHGTQGPNAAFFSRGTGTVVALLEAAHAILEDDCGRALAGGADSGVHCVTWAELVREGWSERGLVPGEGAAMLALAHPEAPSGALGFLDHVSVRACPNQTVAVALAGAQAEFDCSSIDAVVIAPWGPPARDRLHSFAQESLRGRPVFDVELALGESLAASPALAWAVALDLLGAEAFRRVLILSCGIDGDLGIVAIRAGAAR